MPILKEEPSLFPSDVLDCEPFGPDLDRSVDVATQRSWWVIHTKSRQEKTVARHLLARRLPFYLPLIPRTHRIGGRRTDALVPLFPGYVFSCSSPTERIEALKTNRLVQMLAVPDSAELVRDLRQIRHVIASGVPLTPEKRLVVGDRVRIRSGLLASIEGRIIQRRGRDRLLVSVNFMEQGVSIEIDDFLVDPM